MPRGTFGRRLAEYNLRARQSKHAAPILPDKIEDNGKHYFSETSLPRLRAAVAIAPEAPRGRPRKKAGTEVNP